MNLSGIEAVPIKLDLIQSDPVQAFDPVADEGRRSVAPKRLQGVLLTAGKVTRIAEEMEAKAFTVFSLASTSHRPISTAIAKASGAS